VLEWLQHLQLADYYDALTADGYYDDIDHVMEITWEDLEEIGFKKLGNINLETTSLFNFACARHGQNVYGHILIQV